MILTVIMTDERQGPIKYKVGSIKHQDEEGEEAPYRLFYLLVTAIVPMISEHLVAKPR